MVSHAPLIIQVDFKKFTLSVKIFKYDPLLLNCYGLTLEFHFGYSENEYYILTGMVNIILIAMFSVYFRF